MKILKLSALAIVVILAAVYCVVALLLYVKQRDILYPTDIVSNSPRPPEGAGFEQWTHTLKEENADVYAYFLPARTTAERAGLVMYFHGNGNTIDDMLPTMRRYQRMGFHVLMHEYRGYNRSAGTPSQEGITQDALLFLGRALKRSDVDPANVVFHGFSLGGGVACSVARTTPPRALVLQSTFTGVNHIAKSMGMLPWLVKDPYDSLDFVRTFEGPLLVVHGRKDTLLPFKFGEMLAKEAPNARLLPHQGEHNTHPNAQVMWNAINQLLTQGTLP